MLNNNPPIPSTTAQIKPPPRKLRDHKKNLGISVNVHIQINEVITKEKIFAELRLSLLKQRF
jgi:hypothetical protein